MKLGHKHFSHHLLLPRMYINQNQEWSQDLDQTLHLIWDADLNCCTQCVTLKIYFYSNYESCCWLQQFSEAFLYKGPQDCRHHPHHRLQNTCDAKVNLPFQGTHKTICSNALYNQEQIGQMHSNHWSIYQ